MKLGKKVSYSKTYSFETLDIIPREERRRKFKHLMFGVDIWTCYEVSFLLPNGLPQYYVIRLYNLSSSKNIFESKSLKLYLNSFNSSIFRDFREVVKTIERDLSKISDSIVKVELIEEFSRSSFSYEDYSLIDNQSVDRIVDYHYNRFLLKGVRNSIKVEEKLTSQLLRSNCEVTNQPDWATIYVNYRGYVKIDRESLLKYIISYRGHQEFHEPTCERIYQDLYEILEPEYLLVVCHYTRRGGIDINPIRCSEKMNWYNISLPKLLQQ